MSEKIKLLIADDHPIFRAGIVKILEEDQSFTVVGQFGDGGTAFERIEDLQPDIAILDISMPKMDGMEIVKRAKQQQFKTEFIILTMYKDQEYFNEAMRLGAKGYLLKENTSTDLINCIHAIVKGKHYVCADLTEYLLQRKTKINTMQKEYPTLNKLTDMEKRVLRLIAENRTSKEIADQLFISHRTVQNHRAHICEKMGFNGYNKLLQFALENKTYL